MVDLAVIIGTFYEIRVFSKIPGVEKVDLLDTFSRRRRIFVGLCFTINFFITFRYTDAQWLIFHFGGSGNSQKSRWDATSEHIEPWMRHWTARILRPFGPTRRFYFFRRDLLSLRSRFVVNSAGKIEQFTADFSWNGELQ